MQDHQGEVVGGVDTHRQVHVAAVVDTTGRILGTSSFAATIAGYRALWCWLQHHGQVLRVGVEGTSSYGAGLTRYLGSVGVAVVEVNRPDRQRRRRKGKSDTVDAEAAARAALNGDATATPKDATGLVGSIRVLRLARRSAVKARTQAANQIRDLIITAPDQLRSGLEALDTSQRVARCARFKTCGVATPAGATRMALRALARRHQALTTEIDTLEGHITELCAATNPALLGAHGIGPEVAATLLVTAGDNPNRMTSPAAFAALCGASPVQASSGKVIRYRLNTGGDRQANNALWRIALVRMSTDPRTKAYVTRRTQDGKSKKEIIRCLKRYVAREVYQLLINPPPVTDHTLLRPTRTAARISLHTAATALGTAPIRLSRLERGLVHDTNLAHRYHNWLTHQHTPLTTCHL